MEAPGKDALLPLDIKTTRMGFIPDRIEWVAPEKYFTPNGLINAQRSRSVELFSTRREIHTLIQFAAVIALETHSQNGNPLLKPLLQLIK
jgi:hypothetical protein